MINQCAVSDRIRSSHVIEAHRQLQQISQKPAIVQEEDDEEGGRRREKVGHTTLQSHIAVNTTQGN